MLIEETKLKIESGKGGDGSNAMYGSKPEGGDGGKGGDVYLKGVTTLYDISGINQMKVYKAGNGKSGLRGNKKGANGEDLIINVPLVTEVIVDSETKYSINSNNQLICIIKGGKGGLGNISSRKKKALLPTNVGGSAQKLELKLILKLQSDIIFLGFPNAGKSSLLNSLTNANVKTASYEFTTLEPKIALMNGIKLMDLPGLIEGAHIGKGLGTKFVKHTENSKLLAHFVSLDNPNPFETYTKLRDEIKKISDELYNMKEIVVLTKTDEVSKKEVEKVENVFRKKNIDVTSCSIIDDESIDKVKSIFKELLK